MSNGFRLPQRGIAYQPRATPWDCNAPVQCVLKERRISSDNERVPDQHRCGVPLERIRFAVPNPRVQPWSCDGGYECVLKERRIGRARVGGATVCGRSFRTRGCAWRCSQGVALGWYAWPRWGINTALRLPVGASISHCVCPLGHQYRIAWPRWGLNSLRN